MKIELTNVIDRNTVNDDVAFKLLLADSVIDLFTPLFYEETRKKQRILKRNVLDIKKLKQDFLTDKIRVKKLKIIIEKEKVRNKILEEIDYLSDIDVVYGSNRQLIKNILLTINKQTLGELTKN